MKPPRSLQLVDRPADELVASIMAFLTPPLLAIFADRSRTGRSPEILADAVCLRIKNLARCLAQTPSHDADVGGRDASMSDRPPQESAGSA